MKKIIPFLLTLVIFLSFTSCSDYVIIRKAKVYEPKNESVIEAVDKLVAATSETSALESQSQDITIILSEKITWQDLQYVNEHIKAFQDTNEDNRVSLDMSQANGIDSLKECTFYLMNCLKSIKLPNGLKTIGKFSFYGCDSLEDLVIPNTVEYIGYYAIADNDTEIALTIEGPALIEMLPNSFYDMRIVPNVQEGVKIWTLGMNNEIYALVSDSEDFTASTTVTLYDHEFDIELTQHNDKENKLIWADLSINGKKSKAAIYSTGTMSDFSDYDMIFSICFENKDITGIDTITVNTDREWYVTSSLSAFLDKNAELLTPLEPKDVANGLKLESSRYYFSLPRKETQT